MSSTDIQKEKLSNFNLTLLNTSQSWRMTDNFAEHATNLPSILQTSSFIYSSPGPNSPPTNAIDLTCLPPITHTITNIAIPRSLISWNQDRDRTTANFNTAVFTPTRNGYRVFHNKAGLDEISRIYIVLIFQVMTKKSLILWSIDHFAKCGRSFDTSSCHLLYILWMTQSILYEYYSEGATESLDITPSYCFPSQASSSSSSSGSSLTQVLPTDIHRQPLTSPYRPRHHSLTDREEDSQINQARMSYSYSG